MTTQVRSSPSGPEVAITDGVSSVFGRAGAVVAQTDDYSASQVKNDSSVSGTEVSNALNTLKTQSDEQATQLGFCVQWATHATDTAGGTYMPAYNIIVANNLLTSEWSIVGPFPFPCRISALSVRRMTPAAGTQTATFVLRKGTSLASLADTTLTVEIAATSAALVQDLVHTVDLAAGEVLALNSTGTSDAGNSEPRVTCRITPLA